MDQVSTPARRSSRLASATKSINNQPGTKQCIVNFKTSSLSSMLLLLLRGSEKNLWIFPTISFRLLTGHYGVSDKLFLSRQHFGSAYQAQRYFDSLAVATNESNPVDITTRSIIFILKVSQPADSPGVKIPQVQYRNLGFQDSFTCIACMHCISHQVWAYWRQHCLFSSYKPTEDRCVLRRFNSTNILVWQHDNVITFLSFSCSNSVHNSLNRTYINYFTFSSVHSIYYFPMWMPCPALWSCKSARACKKFFTAIFVFGFLRKI